MYAYSICFPFILLIIFFRLLMDIQYKMDPLKIMNLRIDSLSQIVNMANVQRYKCVQHTSYEDFSIIQTKGAYFLGIFIFKLASFYRHAVL